MAHAHRIKILTRHLADQSKGKQQFRKVLIANRGEIAVRIARAAEELGIKSCAIYSAQDEKSLHIRSADEAQALPTGSDYLDIDAVIGLAKKVNADCIHPGYGFLSERADFAASCEVQGVTFVGPSASVIELFGDKTRARALAKRVGVPVLQGSDAAFNNVASALEFVLQSAIPFPLLLKAAFGGGGRGIRKVETLDDFHESFERCVSEATTAFGRGEVFVEELLTNAKHIEVQVIADAFNNISHAYERDCSVQVRNQKLIEIAPAINISAGLRQRLTDNALQIALAANYVNIGTVEFLVQGDLSDDNARSVFLELNPRIQVEHTVTEQVTGIDLVRAQFAIANGTSLAQLGLTQSSIQLRDGFAIQARLSMTSVGQITALKEPTGLGIRIDSSAYAGLAPATAYDPLLAKVIATSSSVGEYDGFGTAIARLARALNEYWIEGVETNREQLIAVLKHPLFVSGKATTSFALEDGWETETKPKTETEIKTETETKPINTSSINQTVSNRSGGGDGDGSGGDLRGSLASATNRNTTKMIELFREFAPSSHKNANLTETTTTSIPQGAVVPSINGSIVEVCVSVGDRVHVGDVLFVLTAMKMETTQTAATAGIVSEIMVQKGELVQSDVTVMAVISPTTTTNTSTDETHLTTTSTSTPPPPTNHWSEIITQIHERRALGVLMGGKESVDKHHLKGRLSLRERIGFLLDPDSFRETGRIAGAVTLDDTNTITEFTPGNFILGTGTVNNRRVVVGGEDFTIKGGSPTTAGLRKSVYCETLALRLQCPLVRLHEGGGGSVAGSKNSSAPAGDPVFATPRFQSVARCLGEIPVVAAALGPVAGLPASRLVASHFSVMVHNAQVLTAGPKVVGRALGYEITKEELGGIGVHSKSGVVDNIVATEHNAFEQIQQFLSYLPQNVHELTPVLPISDPCDRMEEELTNIIPKNRRQTFDIRRVFELIFDVEPVQSHTSTTTTTTNNNTTTTNTTINGNTNNNNDNNNDGNTNNNNNSDDNDNNANDDVHSKSSFFEIGNTAYGQSVVCGLARINGQSVGVFGNDSAYFAGAMTAEAALKVTRFIDLCTTFHLPIISFLDEPGFMIGVEAELDGTIRHGTAAVLAAQNCSVPWATVHIRKSYGVAAAAHFGPDSFIIAWPSAESGTLPVESGVAVAYGRELDQITKEHGVEASLKRQQELEEAFSKGFSPFPRADCFSVHDLIEPKETRPMLCDWIDLIQPLLPRLVGVTGRSYRP